jgi:hypothetical protein
MNQGKRIGGVGVCGIFVDCSLESRTSFFQLVAIAVDGAKVVTASRKSFVEANRFEKMILRLAQISIFVQVRGLNAAVRAQALAELFDSFPFLRSNRLIVVDTR